MTDRIYSSFLGPRKPLKPISDKRKARHLAWQETSKRIRRERPWCEVQGSGCRRRSTEVHHILQRSLGGDDEDSNLLSCCGWCHAWVHENITEATEAGFLRSSWDS